MQGALPVLHSSCRLITLEYGIAFEAETRDCCYVGKYIYIVRGNGGWTVSHTWVYFKERNQSWSTCSVTFVKDAGREVLVRRLAEAIVSHRLGCRNS